MLKSFVSLLNRVLRDRSRATVVPAAPVVRPDRKPTVTVLSYDNLH